jgi:membrane protein YqaA with SNARE-associated domain
VEFFINYGPWGLALAAFLAGSVVPLPSEAVLIGLIIVGKSAAAMTIVATLGNVAGSSVLLLMGRAGRRTALKKIRPDIMEKAEFYYRKYGPWLLLASWVPVIGDAFVLVAGAFKLPLPVVLPLLALGKGIRYAAVALAAVYFKT